MDETINLRIYNHRIFHMITKPTSTSASKTPASSKQIFSESPFQMEMLEESKRTSKPVSRTF